MTRPPLHPSVEYSFDGVVAQVHLARPERLNAVDVDLTRGLVAALTHAGEDGARAVVLAVAGEDAAFGFPEVSVGLSVTGGISRLLPALVGWARAKELLLLGERVGGTEAAAMGLVARCVPAGEHESAALDLARRMAERPALSLSLAKHVLDAGLDSTVDTAMDREVEHALLTSLSGENDAPREGFNRG